jgi:hypothetical protein
MYCITFAMGFVPKAGCDERSSSQKLDRHEAEARHGEQSRLVTGTVLPSVLLSGDGYALVAIGLGALVMFLFGSAVPSSGRGRARIRDWPPHPRLAVHRQARQRVASVRCVGSVP